MDRIEIIRWEARGPAAQAAAGDCPAAQAAAADCPAAQAVAADWQAAQAAAGDWQAALAALAPAAPLQADHAYGDIAAAAGRGLRRFELRLGGARVGLAQVLGRGGLWLCSRGPVFAPTLGADMRRRLLRRLARRLAGALIVTPETAVSGFGLVPLMTARHQALWDISAAEADLRAALAGKWRNRLVAAERAGLRVVAEQNPDWLIAAEAAQRAARGYGGLPAGFVAAWGQRRRDGVMTLSAQAPDGTRLAGVMVLRHGTAASYHLGWTSARGRAAGAHNLLLWQAALRTRAGGAVCLDLGDVNSGAGAGLMHFKLGTGARPHALGATCLVLPG